MAAAMLASRLGMQANHNNETLPGLAANHVARASAAHPGLESPVKPTPGAAMRYPGYLLRFAVMLSGGSATFSEQADKQSDQRTGTVRLEYHREPVLHGITGQAFQQQFQRDQ